MLEPGRLRLAALGPLRSGSAHPSGHIKGILNISLIEASLKVLTRWYYVPARLAVIFLGSCPLCYRGCELEGTMLHTWWTCPRIRSFWQKVFRTISSITKALVTPDPNIALLNRCIPALDKYSQTLAYFVLLGAKITIAKAWKQPTVSFRGFKRKVSWIMAQEQIVAKLHDQVVNFSETWEPWSMYCGISILPGVPQGPMQTLTP